MAKFIKLVVTDTIHEYFNTNNIIATEKTQGQFLNQLAIFYPTTFSPSYKINSFTADSPLLDYIIKGINAANSSSHTNNVYDPQKTQGLQVRIDNIQ